MSKLVSQNTKINVSETNFNTRASRFTTSNRITCVANNSGYLPDALIPCKLIPDAREGLVACANGLGTESLAIFDAYSCQFKFSGFQNVLEPFCSAIVVCNNQDTNLRSYTITCSPTGDFVVVTVYFGVSAQATPNIVVWLAVGDNSF